VDFLPLLGLDLAALCQGRGGPVAANGQYLLVRADHYRAVGGHASIHDALVDDIALARRFRACGHAVALVDGQAMLSCRMYVGARQVWAGFAKNLWLGLATASDGTGKRPRLAAGLFAWCFANVCIIPFAALLVGPARWLAAAIILWLLLLRAAVNRFLRRSLVEVAVTPVALWCVMALSLDALVRRWRGRPVIWKGRAYPAAR
jgi:glycosyl transferase family 21